MKEIALEELLAKKKGPLKEEFYARELKSLAGFLPGEWVLIRSGEQVQPALVNPFVVEGPSLRLLKDFKIDIRLNESEFANAYLKKALKQALGKRSDLGLLEEGCRLVFGNNDWLPGLIADKYGDVTLVQINSAGLDRYRDNIKNILLEFVGGEILFFDNQKYRKREGIPIHESDNLPAQLSFVESNIKYNIPKNVVQKIGYYYDHRINREKLQSWLKRTNLKIDQGLDLFSYVGSWGLKSLEAGVSKMTFVDQGDFKSVIDNHLEMNDFSGRGEFYREDVFKFLKDQKNSNKKYQLIISDPPAFSKTSKNLSKALGGYEKLHRQCLELIDTKGLFVAASCTYGVSLEDLDKTVERANQSLKRDIVLLDAGVQGPDHVIPHLSNQGNYIKFLLYLVQ